MTERQKFVPTTKNIIADFLGDLWDGHPCIGRLDSGNYDRLNQLATNLLMRFEDEGYKVIREVRVAPQPFVFETDGVSEDGK